MSAGGAFAGLDAGFGGVGGATERDVERKRIGPETEPAPPGGAYLPCCMSPSSETLKSTCSSGSVRLYLHLRSVLGVFSWGFVMATRIEIRSAEGGDDSKLLIRDMASIYAKACSRRGL